MPAFGCMCIPVFILHRMMLVPPHGFSVKLSIVVVQTDHEVELSCHRQQSVDQSADHLLPIQLAKLIKGALLKLL